MHSLSCPVLKKKKKFFLLLFLFKRCLFTNPSFISTQIECFQLFHSFFNGFSFNPVNIMSCCNKACSFKQLADSTHLQYVNCWLCENIMHAKCAGLTGRECDKINSAPKKHEGGLRWACPECFGIQFDFTKMYNSVRIQFLKLSKAAKLLASDFDSGSELLSQFKFESSSNPCTNENFLSVPSNSSNLHSLNTNSPIPTLDVSSTISLSPSPSRYYNLSSTPSLAPDAPALPVADMNTAPGITEKQSDRKRRSSRTTAPAATVVTVVPPSPSTQSTLSVVAPRRAVFVSRLSADTTCEAIASYIASKSSAKVSVSKFNFSVAREISSFKINVPNDDFPIICDSNFWPPLMIVHEFKPKKRTHSSPVTLPNNISTNTFSKN